jgi:putative ABC transport system substrate-binding protein
MHEYLAAFHRGLAETGYVEGRNVAIEYRWGLGQNDRLPMLVAELVRRQVSVLVAMGSTNSALAAKEATKTIPIIFMQGADPIRIGLVNSLNRPGGNVTGINIFLAELAAKRLQMLFETVTSAKSIGYLRNPSNPNFAESETREVEDAARALGVRLLWGDASRVGEIEPAFANFMKQRVDAAFVSADGFLVANSDHIVALAVRHALPTIYGSRKAAQLGGLMSYDTDFSDAWRQTGVYAGRVLKGEKPADLPVQQVTKIELVINLKTARALGLTIPLPLLGRADEVIE